MSRSVNYLDDAQVVTYLNIEYSDDEYIAEMEWNDLVMDLTEQLTSLFPSLTEADKWDNRETKIFLESSLVEVGISEYCGLISLSIRPVDDDAIAGIASHWINQIQEKFIALGTLKKIGTFSNGESVYERN